MLLRARMKTPTASQADTKALVTTASFLVKPGSHASPSGTKGRLHPFSASEQRTVLRSLRLASSSRPQNETDLRKRQYVRREQGEGAGICYKVA